MRLLALLALAACSEPADKTDAADDTAVGDDTAADTDDTEDTEDTDDTDDTDVVDTGDTSCAPLDVVAEPTDVATVIRVSWRTDVPTVGRVAFGEGTAYDLVTPDTAGGTEHSVLLLGVTADRDVGFRVESETATCAVSSDGATRTGSFPAGLYPARATGAATWTGYQVVPLQGTGYAVVILDRNGRYVWYHQTESSGNLMRAFLSADGQHVLLCHAGPQDRLQDGKIVKISLDGSEVTEIAFPYMDHDMVELPDGTIAAIVVDTRDGDTADKIVELHPDGTLTEIWSAWDNWTRESVGVPASDPNWTHANGLDYDAANDVYYISLKSMGTLAKIDRGTGELLWSMNGRANQFENVGFDGVQMHHQFEVYEDSILFFENGEPSRGYSRAVEVAVDEEARTLREIWSYVSDPPLYVFAKGDVYRFEDGVTQVVWSSAGQIQNVTSDGEVVWQLDLELGQATTFVQYVPSMYASQW